jgi:nucleoid-associated protein YgaU
MHSLRHIVPLLYNWAAIKIPEGEFMANLSGLASFVSELRVVRTNLVDELRHVDAALSVLGKLSGGSSYTKSRHRMSAAARKRMSLAQKARWAKAKGHAPKPQRTISAAGKKRIAAAQRARWAKIRAAKKG